MIDKLKFAPTLQPDLKIVPAQDQLRIVEQEVQDVELLSDGPAARIRKYRSEIEIYEGFACRHCQEKIWRERILRILQ